MNSTKVSREVSREVTLLVMCGRCYSRGRKLYDRRCQFGSCYSAENLDIVIDIVSGVVVSKDSEYYYYEWTWTWS
jgi:hypothetical protein